MAALWVVTNPRLVYLREPSPAPYLDVDVFRADARRIRGHPEMAVAFPTDKTKGYVASPVDAVHIDVAVKSPRHYHTLYGLWTCGLLLLDIPFLFCSFLHVVFPQPLYCSFQERTFT